MAVEGGLEKKLMVSFYVFLEGRLLRMSPGGRAAAGGQEDHRRGLKAFPDQTENLDSTEKRFFSV